VREAVLNRYYYIGEVLGLVRCEKDRHAARCPRPVPPAVPQAGAQVPLPDRFGWCLQAVPSCRTTASWEDVVGLFMAGCDHVLTVDP
jgi:hypothetical protein